MTGRRLRTCQPNLAGQDPQDGLEFTPLSLLHARRRDEAVKAGAVMVFTQVAMTGDHSRAQIDEAMQATHDMLIEHAGAGRLTGVRWVHYHRDHAVEVLETLGYWSDVLAQDVQAEADLRAAIAKSVGGVLVIAMAEVDQRLIPEHPAVQQLVDTEASS